MKKIPRIRRTEVCSVHLSATVPKSLYEHMKAMCKLEKCTKSEYIRRLIELDISLRGKDEGQRDRDREALRALQGHGDN
jgi:hypothetical protein